MLAGAHVLVVDDDGDICRMVATVLRGRGASVVEARSGAAALVELERSAFGCVVLDWNLADTSALALVDAANKLQPGLKRTVVVMTGDLLAADEPHAAETQGMLVLRKPFRPSVLVDAVADVLAG